MTTGERIRSLRKARGISAETLAAALNVSRATMFRYESGEIGKLPGSVLKPLARELHTTPAYLMGWEEDTDASPSIHDGDGLSSANMELLEKYHMLPASERKLILDMIDTLVLKNQREHEKE